MRARLREYAALLPPAPAGVPARLERVGFIAALLGLAWLVFGELAASTVVDGVDSLEPQAEFNIYAFASAGATLVAAVGALLVAVAAEGGRQRSLHGALAAVLTYLAADDMLMIHERGGDWLRAHLGLPDLVGVRLWPIVYLPLLAATFLLLAFAARAAARAGGRQIAVGAGLLVLAVLLEPVGILTEWIQDRGYDAPRVARRSLEEGFEQAGWILIATGLIVAFAVAVRAEVATDGEAR